MAKKPLITDWIKTIIAITYNENRNANAKAIQQMASHRCNRKLGLSTVQRELAKLRKDSKRGSTDPRDDQWSLASLNKYPVESRDIPFLLYLQSTYYANVPEVLRQYLERKGLPKPFMSNRLAIWVSRLIRLLQNQPPIPVESKLWTPPGSTTGNAMKWPEWVDDLVSTAMWYSNYEIGCELAHVEPINTIYFDAPTLEQIKLNIIMYNHPNLKGEDIKTYIEPDSIEKLESLDIRDIVKKGGIRNARTHNKKR